VKNPRGYSLGKGEKFTIQQAVALAGGLTETASKGSARIIRHENGSSLQTPIDLNKALRGKSQGVELNCDDILFIPDKNRARRSSPYMDPPMTFPDEDPKQRPTLPS
jgi:protein involved in polysaccharide export with SLBB domain